MQRTDWEQLAAPVRAEIERRTGPVRGSRTATAGENSAIAALLSTDRGPVFVKGIRTRDRRAAGQDREAAINPYVSPLSPQLLWYTEADGWSLLGFQAAPGRHADYSPGSADLPLVTGAMRRLALLPCPELPQLKRAERRWAEYMHEDDLSLLCGETLLHTDYNPANVLIDGSRAQLIDWAWPTFGAAWIDPCCLIVRLISAGHTPEQAEASVQAVPAWADAPARSVDVFASALARMWAQIADADPKQWKQGMAGAARLWDAFRRR